MNMILPAYRIHLSNGTSYVTNMAHGITLLDAIRYFVGNSFEQSDGSLAIAIKVETA